MPVPSATGDQASALSAMGETRKLAAIFVSGVVGAREGPARGERAPS
jgi:hypothetical protein